MRVTLRVTEGPYLGQVFNFQGHDTFLVGRSRRAHLRLPPNDRYFSRVHFLVEINPPQIRLMDMESRNGTYVNGQRVETIDLKDTDIIKAGHTVFQVTINEADGQMTNPPVAPPVESVRPSSGSHPSLPTLNSALGAMGGPGTLNAATGGLTIGKIGQPPGTLRNPPGGGLVAPLTPVVQPAQRTVNVPPVVQPILTPEPVIEPPALIPTCLSCLCPLPNANLDTVEGQLCPPCQEVMHTQQQVIPGYCILKELGRGGMGVVSLACRERDFRLVAMKTIIPAVDGNQAEVQKFLREADILRQLDHPNIVKFIDMSSSNGRIWFAMDYIRGTDARKLIKSGGALGIQRAVRIVCQLLDALEYAHERGFVHRDIKPANLLLTDRAGREMALLADFGLARVYQASQLSGLTMTGAIGGTPLFMAPEQITHYRQAQPPVDQYASGMTLYNLLTANYAYNTSDQFRKWVQMVLDAEPTPVRTYRPEIPPALAEIIHRALLKDPSKRYPNVKAMRQVLQDYA